MKKLIMAALAATGLMATSPATADVFEDGIFETSEYSAYGDNFGVWDQNDDGLLNDDEFNDGWAEVGFDDSEGAFEDFDDDRNGYLDDNEFFNDDDFGVMDTNRDGLLDTNEWF